MIFLKGLNFYIISMFTKLLHLLLVWSLKCTWEKKGFFLWSELLFSQFKTIREFYYNFFKNEFNCINRHFKLDKMTKGLTGLSSHNSNMVAPYEQNDEGGLAIYHTKSPVWQRDLQKGTHNPFFTMIQITPVITSSF